MKYVKEKNAKQIGVGKEKKNIKEAAIKKKSETRDHTITRMKQYKI